MNNGINNPISVEGVGINGCPCGASKFLLIPHVQEKQTMYLFHASKTWNLNTLVQAKHFLCLISCGHHTTQQKMPCKTSDLSDPEIMVE